MAALLLMYHRISDTRPDPWGLCVSPARLAEQMAVLRKYGNPRPLSRVLDAHRDNANLTNYVAVTFDDGYLDNLTAAKPVLEQHDIPATVFVCTNAVGRNKEFWWDQLALAILEPTKALSSRLRLRVDARHLAWDWPNGILQPNHGAPEDVDASTNRRAVLCAIRDALMELPHSAQEEAMRQIRECTGISDAARAAFRTLGPDDLLSLANNGLVTIGAHTASHPLLSAHAIDVQAQEILQSRTFLQNLLGRGIDQFAYPYGDYDQRTVEILRKEGFACACTTTQRALTLRDSIYELPRLAVQDWNGERFHEILHSSLRDPSRGHAQECSEWKRAVADRDGQIANLASALAEREKEVTALRRSTSWRITTPLRMAGGQLRRVSAALGKRPRGAVAPAASVRFGKFDRVTPIAVWGAAPLDRYYIEDFLQRHAQDIRGHVLEFHDRSYTLRFGGSRVTRSDVMNIELNNPNSTFVGDLAGVNDLPTEAFDCVILTQVLSSVYGLQAAIRTLHRVLKKGGVVLATMPGITPFHSMPWPWMWTFTASSAERLFAECFPIERIGIEAHGNVLAAIAFLHGLSPQELSSAELNHHDAAYPVILTVRAVKPTEN
jgi:peptidoglycan/xylan/chitin deacetylase (PgdA/CDA1 family)/SAM-dependent methyltransferase